MRKIIIKNKGYKEMKIDYEKDLVTVTGSIDMKELVEKLKKKLKKDVEIVLPKKESGGKKDGGDGKAKGGKRKDGQGSGDGGDGKAKEGKGKDGQGSGDGGAGNGKRGKGKDGQGSGHGGAGNGKRGKGKDGQGSGDGSDNKVVGNGMHNEKDQFGYPYMDQIFSDENPNACSIL